MPCLLSPTQMCPAFSSVCKVDVVHHKLVQNRQTFTFLIFLLYDVVDLWEETDGMSNASSRCLFLTPCLAACFESINNQP